MSDPTALVIDDNGAIRWFISLSLQARGWRVSEASTASEGLKAFKQLRPELITLDLLMPINDGLDSLHLARIIKMEPRTTLFVASAFVDRPDVERFLRTHEIPFFRKSSATEKAPLRSLFTMAELLMKRLQSKPQKDA
jgi:CheY-like chemotaxis protein